MPNAEDPHEKAKNEAYFLGISSGLEQASGDLLEASAQAFKDEQDESARLLRRWARTFKEKGKKAHPRTKER